MHKRIRRELCRRTLILKLRVFFLSWSSYLSVDNMLTGSFVFNLGLDFLFIAALCISRTLFLKIWVRVHWVLCNFINPQKATFPIIVYHFLSTRSRKVPFSKKKNEYAKCIKYLITQNIDYQSTHRVSTSAFSAFCRHMSSICWIY